MIAEDGQALDLALRTLASADVLYNAAVAERLGISPTDLRCLGRLDELGSATPGQLADWSGLTSGAITGVVQRLLAAGLVRREPDASDGRRVVLTPSQERSELVESLMRPLGVQLGRAAERLTPDQRQALVEFSAEASRILTSEARRLRHRIDG